MAADGLTTVRSHYGPKDTMNRLEADIKAKGMTVFARIDHAAGAEEVGLSLRPTELLIFGNAKGGTPLMQAIQTIASICRSRHWSGRMRRATPGFPAMTRVGSRNGTGWVLKLRRASTP